MCGWQDSTSSQNKPSARPIAIIDGASLPAPDFQTTHPDTDHEPRNPARFPAYPHPCDRPARSKRLGNYGGTNRTFRAPRPQPQS